jgi:RecB family endonuclease NucS
MGKKKKTGSFELDVSFANGQTCNIVLTYPEGHAMTAIHAIRRMAELDFIRGILSANRDDPSVAKVMKERGLEFTGDDDGMDD